MRGYIRHRGYRRFWHCESYTGEINEFAGAEGNPDLDVTSSVVRGGTRYHLTANSALCINKGSVLLDEDDSLLVAKDFDEDDRPTFGYLDIGADQR